MHYSDDHETPPALPCADKLAFDTKQQAQAAAVVADYQRGTKLKTYHCKHCRLWHLASDIQEA